MRAMRGAIFLVIILALLLGYVLVFERGEVVKGLVVLDLDPDEIVKVELHRAQKPKRLVLERKGKSWRLTRPVNAPADKDAVETLLNRFKRLKAELELPEDAKKRPEFGLDKPTTRIVIHDRKGQAYEIQFGTKTPDDLGVYALIIGREKPVVLASWLLDDALKSPDEYRDKRLMVFNKDEVTKVALVYPEREVVCERVGKEEWRLVKPIDMPAETTSVMSILDRLATMEAKEFVMERPGKEKLKAFRLDTPPLEVRLWVKGRKKPLTLRVGKRHETQKSRYYARTYRFPAVVLVDDLDIKEVRKTVNDLRSKKVLVFKREAVRRIVLRYDDTEIDVRKRGKGDEEWWQMVKPLRVRADDFRVDDILWALEGARAEGFIDEPGDLKRYGLDKPQVEVRIWEGGQKRPKAVWVSVREGQGYLRTSEGKTIYKVSATLLEDLKKHPNDLRSMQVVKFKREEVEEIILRWDKKHLRLVKRGERRWDIVEPRRKGARWSAVDNILFYLEDMRAEKWVAERPAPEHGLDEPRLKAEILFEGGRTFTVRFGKDAGQERIYVSSDYSGNQVFAKSRFVLNELKRLGDELLR